MNLIKLGEMYINPEHITALVPDLEYSSTIKEADVLTTHIYTVGKQHYLIRQPISEVVNLLTPTRKAPL